MNNVKKITEKTIIINFFFSFILILMIIIKIYKEKYK